MNLFEIDLTNAKKDFPDYVRNTKIQCTIGKYETTFDVIECDLRQDVFKYFMEIAKLPHGDGVNWPAGIDLETLPVGALIKRIK